jgi:hypothetical protein
LIARGWPPHILLPTQTRHLMDLYHLAKYVHLLALIVAAGVTAVTKLAVGRRARARTVGEALDWHDTLISAARLFPICLVVFAITGGYMLNVLHVSMSTGFAVAGTVGVVLLLASGTFLGVKGAALKLVLEGIAAKGADQPAPRLAPPTLVMMLPTINSGIALAVAFDMVAKPASVSVALGIIVLGIVLGVLGAPRRPSTVAQPAVVPES